MRIRVLIEDTLDKDYDRLVNEHGLSILVETQSKKVLFDVGASSKTFDNAKKLGETVDNVDYAIISHAHFDHGGGLADFVELNDKADIYIKDYENRQYYFDNKFGTEYIGLSEKVINKHNDRIKWVQDGNVKLADNILLFSHIDNYVEITKNNKLLLMKNGDDYVFDDFEHEQVMIIKENNKVYLFTGCCHKGIKNIIESVKNQLNIKKIDVLVGGLHLVQDPVLRTPVSQSELNDVSEYLDANVGEIYTCHCTGDDAFGYLSQTLPDKIYYIRTGTGLDL